MPKHPGKFKKNGGNGRKPVAKKGNGKKAKPFGGKKAKPFGSR